MVKYELPFDFISTEYKHHEELLVQNAIANGYRKFFCIGGDGTLHHMVNGIMKQRHTASNNILIAVIPIGTGNDWVKNYNISSNPEKAVQIILNNTIPKCS